MSGFIDALTALSAHLRERELIESSAKRSWGLLLLAALGLAGIQSLAVYNLVWSLPASLDPQGTVSLMPSASIIASACGTVALSAFLFARLFTGPIRLVQDSADRVALRHEDSPLRDRIRIAQWILIDTAFTRFCLAERALQIRVAMGVLAVGAAGTLCVWLLLAAFSMASAVGSTIRETSAAFALGQTIVLVAFLALTLLAILLTRARGLKELEDAQHVARQVLTFDRDFGGFLPLLERDRVQAVVNMRTRRMPAGGDAP